MAFARINYGSGIAKVWGNFTRETAGQFFEDHANQCFGIRKSILSVEVEGFTADEAMPEPWNRRPEAATCLKHSGDTIVWNGKGEKIKTEWD